MGQDNKKRVAIYARCAQANTLGATAETLADEVGLHRDWVHVDKFIDNGYSGMDAACPRYRAML